MLGRLFFSLTSAAAAIRLSGAILLMASLGYGSVIQVNTRAELAGDDSFEWGTALDELSEPASPYSVTSTVNGLGATASFGGPAFLLLVEGSGSGGNFAPGDVLLYTNFLDGPVTITFDNPVAGGGLQVQRSSFGLFVATITVFGVGNVNLGSFDVNGDSNGDQDNSAVFLGVRSSATDIKALQISVSSPNPPSLFNDLLINRLDIITEATSTEIPEPASALLLLPALAALAAGRWKRNRQQPLG